MFQKKGMVLTMSLDFEIEKVARHILLICAFQKSKKCHILFICRTSCFFFKIIFRKLFDYCNAYKEKTASSFIARSMLN